MPNWVEGSMKLRGPVREIKRFLRTELLDAKHGTPLVEVFNGTGTSRLLESKYATYFKDSRRAFTDRFHKNTWGIDFESLDEAAYTRDDKINEDARTVYELPFEQAWSLDYDWLRNLTERYELDIKVFGYEMGMQFYDIAEYSKGDLIAEDFKSFKGDDYAWEVPFMELGG